MSSRGQLTCGRPGWRLAVSWRGSCPRRWVTSGGFKEQTLWPPRLGRRRTCTPAGARRAMGRCGPIAHVRWGHPQRHVRWRDERLARPQGPQKAMGAGALPVAEATYWRLSTGEPDRNPRRMGALDSSRGVSASRGAERSDAR
jgi:hypothetical protein